MEHGRRETVVVSGGRWRLGQGEMAGRVAARLAMTRRAQRAARASFMRRSASVSVARVQPRFMRT